MVQCLLIVPWVVGSIIHGGPTELFLIPANIQQLVLQRSWHVLSCLLDGAYKRILIGKSSQYSGGKEGNVLFNDTLNTFYLRIYGEREKCFI